MKKSLFFIVFAFISFAAKAQQDSILVVIECDSVYRPFLECSSIEIRYGFNDKYGSSVALDSNLSFNAPLLQNKTCIVRIYGTFQPAFLFINSKDSILKEKKLRFPPDCKYNKFLINNTCEQCALSDSVTWIQFGLAMYDTLPEDSYAYEMCNPYKNPVNPKGYSGGCVYDADACRAHWYCHRCKRAY